jgi:CubicO group peptidase (beta-lactamase class C family)
MIIRKHFFLYYALIALATVGCTAEKQQQEGADFLPQRLERIDQAVNRAIAEGEIQGAVALIIRDGRVGYHKAFGFADLGSGKEMTTDTIFRIASMTKAITTVGVMMLYEQGHFNLNDPVSNYLPEFSDMRVIAELGEDGSILQTTPASAPIRIIDLLSHTSGISYPFIPSPLQKLYVEAGIFDGMTARDVKLGEQIEMLASQPLLFEPGSQFAYGLSTDVLGRLIEVVSGQSLDRFIAENISGPLAMTDTYFYLPDDTAPRLATLYAHVDGEGLVVSTGTESDIKLDNPDYPLTGARSYFSGGAGLSSTSGDYGRFCLMLLNNGELDGVRILSRKSVELMRTARIDQDGDQKPDIALGFNVINNLGKTAELGSLGSYSWGGAFDTSYWIDPQERLVGILMMQARPASSDISQKYRTLVYQALE